MTRWLLGLATVGMACGVGSAQYPQQRSGGYPGDFGGYQGGGGYPYPYGPAPFPGNFLPNYYNRASQPLSPYLNLLRGGNPGVNYFYGVRPGTTGGAGNMVGGGFGQSAYVGVTGNGFIPAASTPDQPPVQLDANQRLPYIPPSSHPVVFGGGPGMQYPTTTFGLGSRAGSGMLPGGRQQQQQGTTAPRRR
jgi:hypothetical protein